MNEYRTKLPPIEKQNSVKGKSKFVRKSQATDVATLIESQNSIFDQLEKINSCSLSKDRAMSNFIANSGPGQALSNRVQQSLPSQQNTNMAPNGAKFRSFRDILESIDEQENDMRNYNQLEALQREKEAREDIYGLDSGMTDEQLRESLQQKLQYDKFCFKNVKASSNLRATQNSSDGVKVGDSTSQTRPSMRPSALAVFAQQSEGVLNRSLKTYQPSYQEQAKDADQKKAAALADQTAHGQNPQQPQKEPLNITVQDSAGLQQDAVVVTSNSDLAAGRNDEIQQQSPDKTVKPVAEKTPQGIVKRVMPDKIERGLPLDPWGIEMQAHSLDPEQFGHENFTSMIRGDRNNVMVLQTHRAPEGADNRVPPLTDELNTNLKNVDSSQISMNIHSTFRQEGGDNEEDGDAEEQPNCYLILPWDDISLIIESINEDHDQMKIYFGCKGLKSILMVSPAKLCHQVVKRYSNRLLRRLVLILGYEHLPDTMAEALHIIVLLTNLTDHDITSEMVVAGLVHQLNKFIDTRFLQTRSSKLAAELALQIMANVTQISNLSINHIQLVYIPEVVKDDEATMPGLNFIDRMISLCQMTEATTTAAEQNLVTRQSPRSPILLSEDANQAPVGTYVSQSMASCSVQVGPSQMADLRIQLGYIARHIICRSARELRPENMAKAISLLLELVVQSISLGPGSVADPGDLAKKHVLIWKSTVQALRMVCSSDERACQVLESNQSKMQFAKSLGTVAEVCTRDSELLPLLMDTLVVIGDLTASQCFTESSFFADNDMFKVLKTVMASPAIAKIEPVFNSASDNKLSKLKFWETVTWMVANAVADDQRCQAALLEKHEDLIEVCFGLAEVAQDEKINLELCYLIENLLQNRVLMKKYLFSPACAQPPSQKKQSKRLQTDQSLSSYKESERAPTADGRGSRRRSRKRDTSNGKKTERQDGSAELNFASFLRVLTRIIKDRPAGGVLGKDDTLDYHAMNCVFKLFKIGKEKVKQRVIGEQSREDVGMPALVEGIYKMEHHWSKRVYEKAILVSRRYLAGSQGTNLHNLTDIYSELCQETMFEPDAKVVERQVAEFYMKAKSRGVTTRRRHSEASDTESLNSQEEEARDRAKTFLMTLAQKRAYEMQKKAEKEFNQRFKIIFISVVSSQMTLSARTMKVIDMTNSAALTRQPASLAPVQFPSPSKSKSRGSKGKSQAREVMVSQLDFDMIADERAVIPRPLLAYHKHLVIRTQRLNERKRKQEMREELLRVAQNAAAAAKQQAESAANALSTSNLGLLKAKRQGTSDGHESSFSGVSRTANDSSTLQHRMTLKDSLQHNNKQSSSTIRQQSSKIMSSSRKGFSSNLSQGKKISLQHMKSSACVKTDSRSKSGASSTKFAANLNDHTSKKSSVGSKKKKF